MLAPKRGSQNKHLCTLKDINQFSRRTGHCGAPDPTLLLLFYPIQLFHHSITPLFLSWAKGGEGGEGGEGFVLHTHDTWTKPQGPNVYAINDSESGSRHIPVLLFFFNLLQRPLFVQFEINTPFLDHSFFFLLPFFTLLACSLMRRAPRRRNTVARIADPAPFLRFLSVAYVRRRWGRDPEGLGHQFSLLRVTFSWPSRLAAIL